MNRIYKSVLNIVTGESVVVSELAKGRKKSGGLQSVLLVSALAAISGNAIALTPGTIANGISEIQQEGVYDGHTRLPAGINETQLNASVIIGSTNGGHLDASVGTLTLSSTSEWIIGIASTFGSTVTVGNNLTINTLSSAIHSSRESNITIGDNANISSSRDMALNIGADSSLTFGDNANISGRFYVARAVGGTLDLGTNATLSSMEHPGVSDSSYAVITSSNGSSLSGESVSGHIVGDNTTLNSIENVSILAVAGLGSTIDLTSAIFNHNASDASVIKLIGNNDIPEDRNTVTITDSIINSNMGASLIGIAPGYLGNLKTNTDVIIKNTVINSVGGKLVENEGTTGNNRLILINTDASSFDQGTTHSGSSDFELSLGEGSITAGGATNESTGNLDLNIDSGSSLTGDITNTNEGSITGSVTNGGTINGDLTNNGSGQIDFDITQGGALNGDVIKNGEGDINLTVDEGGTWSGTGHNIRLWVKNASTYRMQNESSSFIWVKLDNNSTLDFGTPKSDLARNTAYTSFKSLLSTGDMTQTDGGVANVLMSTNLGAGKGDLISVNGNMTGTYLLNVTNYGVAPSAANESLRIVQNGGGDNTISLTGNQYRDAGMYRYHLVKDDSGSGTWLVNGDGSGASHGGGDDDTSNSGDAYNPDGSFAGFVPPTNWAGNQICEPDETCGAGVGVNPQRQQQVSDLALVMQGSSAAQTISLLNQSRNIAKHTEGLRLAGTKGDQDVTLWINNFTNQTDVDASVMGRKFKMNANTTYIGVDKAWDMGNDSTLVAGAFTGAGYTDNKYKLNDSKGNSDIYTGGVYGMWLHNSGLFADMTAQGYRIKTSDDAYTEQGQKTSYDMSSSAYSLGLDIGQRFDIQDSFYIEPSIKLAYLRNGSDSFNTGGASRMQVKKESADVFQYGVGLNIGKTIATSAPDAFVQPYLGLTVLGQNVSGGDVKSSGVTMKSDLDGYQFQSNLGVNWQMNKNNGVFTEVNAGTGDKFNDALGVGVGYRYTF